MPTSPRWDIVCRVVDNFGDAGVCLRLARELAAEHGIAVTLWIDDVASLARIVPGLDAGRRRRRGRRHSRARARNATRRRTLPLPDVVIEGFGCGLPEAYVAAMAASPRRRVWIVLEYLSAEPWIDASHGAAVAAIRGCRSRAGSGFRDSPRETGGLLREARPPRRGATPFARSTRPSRGAVAIARACTPPPGALHVSLFCYANPALAALLDVWAEGDEPVVCIGARRRRALRARPRGPAARCRIAGAPLERGRSDARRRPVRRPGRRSTGACGPATSTSCAARTRSCARNGPAQPFVWHVYPQEADAHLAKMDAFLTRLEAAWRRTAARRAARVLVRVERGRRRSPRPMPGRPTATAMPRIGCRRGRLGAGLARAAGPGRGSGQVLRKSGYNFGFTIPDCRPTDGAAERRRHGPGPFHAPGPPHAASNSRNRYETRSGSARRQCDHGRQGPDGRAEGRILEVRPQRVGRQDEAQEPPLRQPDGDDLPRRREVRRDPAREEGSHVLVLRRSHVRVHGRRVQPVRRREGQPRRRAQLPRGRARLRAHVLRGPRDLRRAAEHGRPRSRPTPSPRSRATRRAR